jgi:hypothetical protein
MSGLKNGRSAGEHRARRSTDDPVALQVYRRATFVLCHVRAKPAANVGASLSGDKAIIIHQYVAKAVQDDAQRVGERNRLVLEARRVRMARRERVVPAAPVRQLARLLLRRAAAWTGRVRWSSMNGSEPSCSELLMRWEPAAIDAEAATRAATPSDGAGSWRTAADAKTQARPKERTYLDDSRHG